MSGVLTFRETVKLVRDYLEVAFHTLLYIRQVYPAQLFAEVKKYNIPIWQSRHPMLNEYLGRILECIQEEMEKGTIQRVILVVKDAGPEETPLERFIFEFEWLIPERDLPKAGDDFTPATHGLAEGDVEELLRACLLKLHHSSAYLKRLSGEVSFAILLELKDDAPPPESKAAREGHVGTEWVPADSRHAMEDDGEGPGRGPQTKGELSSISPLEAIRLGMINMDMRVEECAAKFEEEDDQMADSSAEVAIHKLPDRKGKGRAF